MAGQINCMHSKLQLLSHPTHLRIAVPSANLVPYDWGESGGVMENVSAFYFIWWREMFYCPLDYVMNVSRVLKLCLTTIKN